MIRAAIAGLGWWGQHMVRRMKDSAELKILMAIETSAALAPFAKDHGLEFTSQWDLDLKDASIDAVILCTPHSMHTEQVLAVAGAAKHVFCEKPLALTRADAERSVDACRRAGVVLGIGHERRFEPALAEIGARGRARHDPAHRGQFQPRQARRPAGIELAGFTARRSGGGNDADGVHLTDAFIELLGPIAEVYATTTSLISDRRNGDVVSVHVRFASGVTGYLSALLVTPLYIKTTVFGSNAWAEARNETHPDTPGPTTLTVLRRDGKRDVVTCEWADTVRANLEAFARAIEGRGTYPFTDEQKIGNVAVLEAVCRSAATSLPVETE